MSNAAASDWRYLNAKRVGPEKLLREYGIISPPVDVFGIARSVGVDLVFVRDADWDGAVESDSASGAATIYVNVKQSSNRQRFTCAHELGHLIQHPPGRSFRDTWSSLGTSLPEIQANAFAASLLMPASMVKALAPGRTVDQLASAFKVSRDAMTIRLKNLGYRIS